MDAKELGAQPAFPVQDAGSWQGHGVSQRMYLAAHAPAEPQPWFTPSMPPKPEEFAYRGAARSSIEIKEQAERNAEWLREERKQRYMQWPCAWADALLSALAKVEK